MPLSCKELSHILISPRRHGLLLDNRSEISLIVHLSGLELEGDLVLWVVHQLIGDESLDLLVWLDIESCHLSLLKAAQHLRRKRMDVVK